VYNYVGVNRCEQHSLIFKGHIPKSNIEWAPMPPRCIQRNTQNSLIIPHVWKFSSREPNCWRTLKSCAQASFAVASPVKTLERLFSLTYQIHIYEWSKGLITLIAGGGARSWKSLTALHHDFENFNFRATSASIKWPCVQISEPCYSTMENLKIKKEWKNYK